MPRRGRLAGPQHHSAGSRSWSWDRGWTGPSIESIFGRPRTYRSLASSVRRVTAQPFTRLVGAGADEIVAPVAEVGERGLVLTIGLIQEMPRHRESLDGPRRGEQLVGLDEGFAPAHHEPPRILRMGRIDRLEPNLPGKIGKIGILHDERGEDEVLRGERRAVLPRWRPRESSTSSPCGRRGRPATGRSRCSGPPPPIAAAASPGGLLDREACIHELFELPRSPRECHRPARFSCPRNAAQSLVLKRRCAWAPPVGLAGPSHRAIFACGVAQAVATSPANRLSAARA